MNKVAVLIGSDTDRSTMEAADKYYEHFGIDCEILTMSAHRNPVEVHDFCTKAPSNGYKILVGAAGMAAHLAGVIAAHTHKPVLGIPLGGGDLNGIDSLLSTVQMPKGIPVATFAIGKSGAINAALFAVQILSQNDETLSKQFDEYRTEQTAEVIKINEEN